MIPIRWIECQDRWKATVGKHELLIVQERDDFTLYAEGFPIACASGSGAFTFCKDTAEIYVTEVDLFDARCAADYLEALEGAEG